jgi:hypothetical protein
MLIEIDPEEEHHKLVYAKFGLAVYFSQVFEQGLVNLITLLDAANAPGISKETFDGLLSSHSKKTLGILLKKVNKYVKFSPETTEVLETALSKRNYLIHYYFYEHVPSFVTEEGRNKMLSDLEEIRVCLSEADKRIDPVTQALTKKLGFTEEMLQEAAIELVGEEHAHKII